MVALVGVANAEEDCCKRGVDLFAVDGVWTWFVEDGQTDRNDVWQVADGVITCKGTPLGYLRTKKDYTDFVLTLEWRHPASLPPGRGGV